ncbi:IclR family transcriptional regulator [Burkholderia vietnamiensis]|nr:IclR family transcriptional regulator [Burkholderia vietnamiensis]RQM60584.1 IclR family transcriptional regulator [Burkholderia vietnamiensis]HDR8928569.1 IclR family transcriptional regulator [Burkholderia vietnamiensis]HDR8958797.1 IclR family transcriptional regulator [Burkholderia vietnamiensis]HDR8996417.1 IclR family transcriptional regulator [Burkholderia vietnamiensis]
MADMRNPETDPSDSGNPVRRKKVNYRAPALEKGLDILELLIDRQYGMAQADICRALKRSRSELYRMMQVLEERGYIYRIDRHDRYALTMKLYFLGQHHAPTRSLGALVTPAMQEFTLQTVQSCYLTVFDGDTMIVIAAADAETEWNIAVRVGTRVPLQGSAAGEMYGALQGDDARSRLLRAGARAVGLPGASGHDEAAASRWADGCIRRPNARIAGVTDIATPIVDKTGAAIAILACPYLMHPDDAGAMPVEQVGVALYETARRIAATVDQRFMQSAVETPARRATCA